MGLDTRGYVGLSPGRRSSPPPPSAFAPTGRGSRRQAAEPSVLPPQFSKKQRAGSGRAERKNQGKTGFFSWGDAPPPSLGCRQRRIQNCTAAWSNSEIVLLDYSVPIFQIYSHFRYYSLWHRSREAFLQGARIDAEVTITARYRSAASPPAALGWEAVNKGEGEAVATRFHRATEQRDDTRLLRETGVQHAESERPVSTRRVGSGSCSILICLVELRAYGSKSALGLEPGPWYSCALLAAHRNAVHWGTDCGGASGC